MKIFFYTLIFLFFISFKPKSKLEENFHQDFYIIKDYGNIKTRIETGYHYEEIQKVEFIGMYAELLCKKHDYKKDIFLDFNHFYVKDCEPDYFISEGKKTIPYLNYKHNSNFKNKIKTNGIIIRQISRKFDIVETLKLIEYAILNQTKIKFKQKRYQYKKNYSDLKVYSIDTLKINSILKKEPSKKINNVLKKKLLRKNKLNRFYYTQYGKFYIYYTTTDRKLKKLALNNVYDFKTFSKYSAIIFDTDSSFYFLPKYRLTAPPKKFIIKKLKDHYQPFVITEVDNKRIAIKLNPFSSLKDRTILYDHKVNTIIQNLDSIFKQ